MEPLRFLLPDNNDHKFALIILNCPLENSKKKLSVLWRKAIVKVCTDGAANRLYNLESTEALPYIPDAIIGDFDSAKKHVLEYYESKGSKVVETPDQDDTDFTKALKFVLSQYEDFEEVVVLCGLSSHESRLDHMFGNIHTLFQAGELTDKPVWFVYGDSMSILLQPGKYTFNVNTGLEGDWCGLIPIGHPCHDVTTTGLKWNLDHGKLEFGMLVSTSNTWDGSGLVTMETSDTLLWTMGIEYNENS